MGIYSMINWITGKDNTGKEINVGYVLENEPQTIQDIEKVFKAFRLKKYFEAIKPLVKPAIEITLIPTPESEFESAKSKVGGQPHLTPNLEWPKNELGKSLSFIAQLRLDEFSMKDETNLLPKKGLISFFYCADQEAWGYDPKDEQRFKVLYFEEADETEKRIFPDDLESESIFNANKLSFESSLSIPNWEDDSISGLIKDKDFDNYMDASYGLDNQIFGYANCVQGPMELECQLVTNGLFCGDETGYEDPRRLTLEEGKSDWVLLLQIDSYEEETGMMWGDSGRIYFWIKKQDLQNKDFDKTWCILQCY